MDIYFDCGSGISGDMTLGALVDLGVPVSWLQEQLEQLPLDGFTIKESSVFKNGIAAKKIDVLVAKQHHSRNYADIKSLIEKSPLSDRAKQLALATFARLAQAESAIHGCDIEQVHFHEVGGVDAIVDITGTALGIDYLNIKKIAASPLPLGSGKVECCHGTLPLPAPATVALLKNIPVYGSGLNQELVTPTGAAIITTLTENFGPLPPMIMDKTGYGAGSRDIETVPNLLRIISGTFTKPAASAPGITAKEETILIVETCLDDMNPEIFSYLMECLFADGALDVYWIPIYMKKNRPGTMLQVLCEIDDKEKIVSRILSETTSAGVRHYVAGRSTLSRRPILVETKFGPVQSKQFITPSGEKRITPEYEACRKIAQRENIPLTQVYQEVALVAEKSAS